MAWVSPTDPATCINLINQPFVQHSDIVSYFLILVIVIFFCADWKYLEGVVRSYWVANWVAA